MGYEDSDLVMDKKEIMDIPKFLRKHKENSMKDLIIGLIIGSLLTSGIFVYALQISKTEKMESRIETISNDIERITQKIGGLPPEKVRKK